MFKQNRHEPEKIIQFLKNIREILGDRKSMSPPRNRWTIDRTTKKISQEEHLERTTERKKKDGYFEGIEKKIDTLTSEVSKLAKRQDKLEQQHKVLFLSIKQITDDKERQQEKRDQLVAKLDQMLEIQKRQEENLNQFKSLFRSRRQLTTS